MSKKNLLRWDNPNPLEDFPIAIKSKRIMLFNGGLNSWV